MATPPPVLPPYPVRADGQAVFSVKAEDWNAAMKDVVVPYFYTASGEAEASAVLAGAYANADTDEDIPGAAPGERGAKFYADAAEAWAEGTLPGGAGTKSAKEHAEDSAISAATAESASGPTYASTAAGLAATASGQAFAVDAGGGLVSVYLNSSGTAVLQRTLATTGALAASGGAGAVGFVQAGTGAVSRTAQAKLRDIVSVKDFGAVGDGVTDDTAAIQAAINFAAAARKALVWPAGVYMVDTLPTPQDGAKWIADGEVIIRRRPSSTANVLLLASNKIECAGITFDGNKANNSVACNAVVVTASESRFDRCHFINAKLSGGFGDGLVYAETAVTADSDHSLWDCYAYDNDGRGFAGTNMRGLEAIGNTAHSNGKSGMEFNNYDLTLTQKLYDCRLIGNYCYENGENGIYVGNFIESNNLSILDYGPANFESYRFIVAANVCTANNFYGISGQGESISIGDNICVSNAQSNPAFGGILLNARASRASGNLVNSNLGFGIDAGGAVQSIVAGNQIYVNSGTGLNVGATVNTAAKGNHLFGNGGANGIQIEAHNVDTDAAGRALPSLTTQLAVTQNHIVLTTSTQRGVYLHDGVSGVIVADNDFYGSVPANMIVNIGKRTVIKNNRVPADIPREVAVSGGAVAIPDVFDYVYTNSTSTITSLDYATVQGLVTRTGIAWVDVTAGGTGYTTPPAVVFTGGGGSGAAATAHIRNGAVIGVRMTNFGTGYTSAPTVSFTGGGGSGATGTAQVGIPLSDFREVEIETLQACTINRAGSPVVESKAAANLSMAANDAVKLRSKFGQWYVNWRAG